MVRGQVWVGAGQWPMPIASGPCDPGSAEGGHALGSLQRSASAYREGEPGQAAVAAGSIDMGDFFVKGYQSLGLCLVQAPVGCVIERVEDC